MQAPVRPKPKAGKPVKSSTPKSESISTARKDGDDGNDAFRTSKRDKRHIKHSSFLSKIEKPHAKSKHPLKRRRPSKKLAASLESLAEALPDADDDDTSAAVGRGGAGADLASQANVIQHKSLKHRPGALKRKEKLDRLERDRFGKNMAQMVGGISDQKDEAARGGGDGDSGGGGGDTSARWSALRSFISQTMDQNPEFKGSKPS